MGIKGNASILSSKRYGSEQRQGCIVTFDKTNDVERRKSLLHAERDIYSEYFDRAVKYMKNKNLETLFYFNSVKIEGYIYQH